MTEPNVANQARAWGLAKPQYVVPALPYDPNDPPASPPDGSVNRLMWLMAHQLFHDHRPDADGFCVTCVPGQFLPCLGRHLAERGFRAACGASDTTPVPATDRTEPR